MRPIYGSQEAAISTAHASACCFTHRRLLYQTPQHDCTAAAVATPSLEELAPRPDSNTVSPPGSRSTSLYIQIIGLLRSKRLAIVAREPQGGESEEVSQAQILTYRLRGESTGHVYLDYVAYRCCIYIFIIWMLDISLIFYVSKSSMCI